MLQRSVPCYKAFYQDGDGFLHTMKGAASVSVGGRLTVSDGHCGGGRQPR